MGLISQLLANPREMIIFLLLALPGRFMALSLHEFGHAWVANRCGDPTARLMGRLTVNPLKHIDPVGLLMMLFVGIGWAKPVPVNPNNFRNYRADDLRVSLAGVTMNLLLFLVSSVVMFSFLGVALAKLPHESSLTAAAMRGETAFIAEDAGEMRLFVESGSSYQYLPVREMAENAAWYGQFAIEAAFGKVASYIYQMLTYFVVVNIMLAIFNLIPIPPLDGYHVLNDLVLKRPLFADQKATMIGYAVMYGLMFTGLLSQGLGAVQTFIFTHLGSLASTVYAGLNIL